MEISNGSSPVDGTTIYLDTNGNIALKDGAVSTAKIAASAVTGDKIVLDQYSVDVTASKTPSGEEYLTETLTVVKAGKSLVTCSLNSYVSEAKGIVRLNKNSNVNIICEVGHQVDANSTNTATANTSLALSGIATFAANDIIKISCVKDSGTEFTINKSGVISGFTPKSTLTAARLTTS